MYGDKSIKAVHYPITCFNEEDLLAKLYGAACEINKMINDESRKVYVHCTGGQGRGPSTAVAYLCLFKGMKPEEAEQLVKSFRKVSKPDMKAI
mmetsp:Transcript_19842/g.27459  ORF Transcript_19842/g.27459 Transcript_19842/m.27459 type:complete len:93 (+) Transcript_19842:273-551(+)